MRIIKEAEFSAFEFFDGFPYFILRSVKRPFLLTAQNLLSNSMKIQRKGANTHPEKYFSDWDFQ